MALGKDYSDVLRLHSNLNDNKWENSARVKWGVSRGNVRDMKKGRRGKLLRGNGVGF